MERRFKPIEKSTIPNSDRELIQKWLRQTAARQRREKRRLIKQFLECVRKPLAQVTVADIEFFVKFLLTRGVNSHQLLKSLATVKSLLLFGYSIGEIPLNIAEARWPRLRIKKYRKSKGRFFFIVGSLGVGILLIILTGLTPKWRVQKKQHIRSEVSTVLSELNSDQEANLAHPKIKAFLDTIAWAEGTLRPDGYRMQFTGATFSSFADHPRRVICSTSYGQKRCSNAAGRYQFLDTTWDEVAKKLNIENFSPQAQDVVAIELIKIENALEDVKAGRFETAIEKVANRWASLPGNYYGQPQKSMRELRQFYQRQIERYQLSPLPPQKIES